MGLFSTVGAECSTPIDSRSESHDRNNFPVTSETCGLQALTATRPSSAALLLPIWPVGTLRSFCELMLTSSVSVLARRLCPQMRLASPNVLVVPLQFFLAQQDSSYVVSASVSLNHYKHRRKLAGPRSIWTILPGLGRAPFSIA